MPPVERCGRAEKDAAQTKTPLADPKIWGPINGVRTTVTSQIEDDKVEMMFETTYRL